MIKMKTNKQQLVILMLLVIPTTLTIVTTTTQQAFAKNGNSRGQIDASHDRQGLNILYKGSQNERNITR